MLKCSAIELECEQYVLHVFQQSKRQVCKTLHLDRQKTNMSQTVK